MEVICLESDAFYALVKEVVDRMKTEQNVTLDRWISTVEAMKLLSISSKTTLQKYRDEGKIRFSHPSPKKIVYDRDSIDDFLEQHSQDTF